MFSPRFLMLMLAMLAANVVLARVIGPQGPTVVAIPYNPTFLSQVTADNVKSISSKGSTIQGVARQPESRSQLQGIMYTIVGLVEGMYFINLAFGALFVFAIGK